MPRTIRCPKCGLVQLGQEKCKKCGAAIAAPGAVAAPPARRQPAPVAREERSPYQPPASSLADAPRAAPANGEESIFDRDRFLMRQRVFTIHEKYEIWDEDGRPILFIERPGHYLRNIAALFGGIFAGGIAAIPFFWMGERFESGAAIVVGTILSLAIMVVVIGVLSKKRHVHFYRDETKSELLLEILQDQKLSFLTRTFTVNEPGGRAIARLKKNALTDIFRKKWSCAAPDGRPLWEAKEDSILLAIVRRFFTRLVPLCFIFCLPGGQVVGEFNRKFTLLDRYVLDSFERLRPSSQSSGRRRDGGDARYRRAPLGLPGFPEELGESEESFQDRFGFRVDPRFPPELAVSFGDVESKETAAGVLALRERFELGFESGQRAKAEAASAFESFARKESALEDLAKLLHAAAEAVGIERARYGFGAHPGSITKVSSDRVALIRSGALFLLTALAEIVGCFLPYLWLRKDGSPWLLLPASLSLAAFAWLLTLHPTAAGRTYAAYGGVYVATAVVWLWIVEGRTPSRWDLLGASICILGMAIIVWGAR